MAEAEGKHTPALSVRAKAEQDLVILQTRVVEHEARLRDMKAEVRELEAFLKRYDRYETPTPETGVESHVFNRIDGYRQFLRRRSQLDATRSVKIVPQDSVLVSSVDGTVIAKGTSAKSFEQLWIPAADKRVEHGADRPTEASAAALDAVNQPVISTDLEALSPPQSPASVSLDGTIPRPGTRRAIINQSVYDILELVGGAVSIKWLVDYLRGQPSFEFLGTRPEATLSSYLSRDPRFAFSRDDGGWVLTNFTPANDANDQDGGVAASVDQEGGVL
ncbi:hypothetical protein [uncultured Brevundimonas sp.]|uniref:hypothetical protein n=1 Tax=uncultured Brevundimonas sp. TaxID=213418 RepID=UPI0025CF7AAC|nr:hypothetical protein [uncultured Brevundimonas sp.]